MAITYDADDDIKTLWVNGEDVAEVSGQGYVPNGTTEETERPFNIGAGQDFGDGFFFIGQIDDVSVWNEALDADQINCIASNGVAACANPTSGGDFNGDGQLDAADINALTTEILTGGMGVPFDVDGSGTVDNADRVYWVEQIKNTWLGDSNLDGEFNSADFVTTFTAGQYEDDIEGNSTWETGDWNGDADFDSSDFVTAFTSGGYEMGPRQAVAAVPEPASLSVLAWLSLVGAAHLMRRRRTRR